MEIKSAFIGEDSSWVHSIETNLNQVIKFKNGAKPGKYIASVEFIVAKDGSLSEIRCFKDPGFGMGAAVVRVLIKSTKWVPPAGGAKVEAYRR